MKLFMDLYRYSSHKTIAHLGLADPAVAPAFPRPLLLGSQTVK